MPKGSKHKRGASPSQKRSANTRNEARDIPRKTSIVSIDTLKSPKGHTYTILKTDQIDPYEKRRPAGRKRKSD